MPTFRRAEKHASRTSKSVHTGRALDVSMAHRLHHWLIYWTTGAPAFVSKFSRRKPIEPLTSKHRIQGEQKEQCPCREIGLSVTHTSHIHSTDTIRPVEKTNVFLTLVTADRGTQSLAEKVTTILTHWRVIILCFIKHKIGTWALLIHYKL